MTKNLTDYELLRDIYDIVGRVEHKLDERVKCVENDIEEIKNWRSNLNGKIAIITIIFSSMASFLFALLKDIFLKQG